MTIIYYLTVSKGQDSGCGLTKWFWLGCFMRCHQSVIRGCSHLKAYGFGSALLTEVVVGRRQKICFQTHSCGPFTGTAHLMAVVSPRVREIPLQKPQSFYNLISEGHAITSAVFYSLAANQEVLPTLKGRAWHRAWLPGGAVTGGHLRGCQPQPLYGEVEWG